MLRSLQIQNIAIIEAADISFASGLNVLSGETGAGKSIMIDAISAVLGERTSKDLIRTGEPSAKVTAIFEQLDEDVLSCLDELGLERPEDDCLLISRTINLDGRNSCKVNGTTVTVGMLKTLGKTLISIHGQHDSQNLLNPDYHYKYLDALGNLESLHETYLEQYTGYASLYRQYRQLNMNDEERSRRIVFLKFEIQEIESAEIQPGEYDKLLERRAVIRNSEKILAQLNAALAALSDRDDFSGATTLVFDAARNVSEAAKHYSGLDTLSSDLSELSYNLQSAREEIQTALYDCAFDPQEQSIVEDRLNILHNLMNKYGNSEEIILECLEAKKTELAQLEETGSNRDELELQLEKRKEVLLKTADQLSLARKHAASEFEVRIKHELTFLDMPHVELSTQFERCKLNPVGSDKIEFLIAPNPGEALKPLSKIASGGELSRIMLAIQNVLSNKGNVDTIIFDEIDTGVSGSAAEKIAIKLHSVAKHHQVLCITHSAQVAAYADEHYKIQKEVEDGKTFTRVELLDEQGRVEELARILGGVHITDLQRASARELMEQAKKA